MTNKTWTTIYISDTAYDLLKTVDINFHWIIPKLNSDKIIALINLYLESQKK